LLSSKPSASDAVVRKASIWIADAHREDGKPFVVPAEENLSIAKALPKERQPRHGAIALRLPTGYSA
jgi:hypothetical protein